MENKIDNKVAFNIYVWVNFSLHVLFLLGLLFILLRVTINNNAAVINRLHEHTVYILIVPIFIVLRYLFDYLIQPAYFESQILNGEIRFKSLNLNKNNGFLFFRLAFYKRHLIEQTISQQFYNNYILNIDRFGLRKTLILQKFKNGKLYQSTPISISFLGIKKYTNLILSIDRLQEKITLN